MPTFTTAPLMPPQAQLVDFAGNTHLVGDATRFTGAGRVRLTAGILQTAGNAQIGTPTAPGNFEIAGGGLNPGSNSGGQGITPTGSLVCSSGSTLYLTGGNIGGPINVQAGGTANWTGGELDGIWNIAASGAILNIGGTGTRTIQAYGLANYGNQNLPGVLNNAGTTIWSGTCNIDIQNRDTGTGTRGAINNSGTFIAQNDQTFTGGGTFTNTGTLRKQGSNGVTNFGETYLSAVSLNNSGTLDIQSGILSLNAINHNLRSGVVFSGAGRTRLNSGSFNAVGNFSFANGGTFELAGGNLSAPGGSTAVAPATFGDSGTFLWTGGEIDAVVNIGSATSLSMSSTADKTLNGYGQGNYGNVNQPGILNNAGTATWTGASNIVGQNGGNFGALFNNQIGGVFNAQSGAGFNANFSNAGIVNIGSASSLTVPGVFKLGVTLCRPPGEPLT
ncbi:MAG: hypothetical protein JO316_07345 [Abitibacteriaceae bacterium]|nr:hypothetical protein [Abditibacteriaceae bacterium]MBV9865150.1 hypothetical protein [Abditibacteriaceae bacterium]